MHAGLFVAGGGGGFFGRLHHLAGHGLRGDGCDFTFLFFRLQVEVFVHRIVKDHVKGFAFE